MNESAIATPGVYISEVSVLPPSIAQVSTAIPAFIGYTKNHLDENGNLRAPTKIFSLKEYEQIFLLLSLLSLLFLFREQLKLRN